MFGAFSIVPSLPIRVEAAEIPDPTPVTLPRYQPLAQDDVVTEKSLALPNLLRNTGRESLVYGSPGLRAIGLDLKLDVSFHELVPDTSCLPEFDKWEAFTPEEAQSQEGKDRSALRNGGLSPGSAIYLDRRRELAHSNEDAFRTVRRISAPRGKQQARLGNAYEFFRCLEFFTAFWDDPSRASKLPPSPETTALDDTGSAKVEACENLATARTCSGESMPPEHRQNLLTAFIKLVTYDFGCNVSPARVEPRLHLASTSAGRQRKSYTSSNCHFVFQSPTSREAARAGHIYGPVAAVSARPTVNFTTPDAETAQSLDLAREVVAALITAQHRNREGREEVRFGHGQWWTTKHRWGGGIGGPIGREIEREAVYSGVVDGGMLPSNKQANDGPALKRARKTMPIYDGYRMVRPPSAAWDRRAKYEAIGKVPGAKFDDIFVISSLFHHVSILRVRVPLRLLDVLGGSPEPDVTKRSWGRVESWRSPWYDFFDIDQRIAAMRTLWVVMAYQMRLVDGDAAGDVEAREEKT